MSGRWGGDKGAQRSTAQHSTAQPSTVQRSSAASLGQRLRELLLGPGPVREMGGAPAAAAAAAAAAALGAPAAARAKEA